MKQTKYKKRGWYGESHRHYLAAKGVKTAFKKPDRKQRLANKRLMQNLNIPKDAELFVNKDGKIVVADVPTNTKYNVMTYDGSSKKVEDIQKVPARQNKEYYSIVRIYDPSNPLFGKREKLASEYAKDKNINLMGAYIGKEKNPELTNSILLVRGDDSVDSMSELLAHEELHVALAKNISEDASSKLDNIQSIDKKTNRLKFKIRPRDIEELRAKTEVLEDETN